MTQEAVNSGLGSGAADLTSALLDRQNEKNAY